MIKKSKQKAIYRGGVLAFLFLLLTLSLSLTSCDLLFGNKENGGEKENNKNTGYEITAEVGATYADFTFCIKEEMQKVNRIEYRIKAASDSSSYGYDYQYKFNTLSVSNLKPEKEFNISVTYYFSEGYSDSIKKDFNFTTKAVYVPDFTPKYDTIYEWVKFSTKEKIDVLCDKLGILRAESEDGPFVEVKTAYRNEYLEDDTVSSLKKYWYKFRLYKYADSEYKILMESEKPVSISTERMSPEKINEKSVKMTKGIKSLTLSWDPVDDAEWYEITLEKVYSSTPVFEYRKVEGTSYTIPDISAGSTYYVRLYAVNAVGKSDDVLESFSLPYSPKISTIKVEAGQTDATYIVQNNFDYLEEDCSATYTVRESSSEDSAILAGPFTEPVFVRENLIPASEYSPYSFSAGKSGYVHVTYSYTDSDGNPKKTTDYRASSSFNTLGYDEVTNLKIDDITSTTATLSFDELTEDQKFGQTVKYWVLAETNGESAKTASANSSPITVTGLEAGRNYLFKVYALNSGTSANNISDNWVYASVEAITESGLSEPSLKSVVEGEQTGVKTTLTVSWIKINEDDGENVDYGIEGKVLKNRMFRSLDFVEDSLSFDEATNTYSAQVKVNAGNRYFIRVYAYKTAEPACKSYSSEKEIQTAYLNDRLLATAIVYPEDDESAGIRAGDVIDFVDTHVWENGASIRSTLRQGYNFGLTQFNGASPKFRLPTGQVEYFAFKFCFKSAYANGIDASYSPSLIFLDSSGISSASPLWNDYGSFEEMYIVTPDADGSFIKTYKKSQTNMPYFIPQDNGSLSASVKCSAAGITVEEEWLYNNSVYVGVKQTVAGNLGFSYYY